MSGLKSFEDIENEIEDEITKSFIERNGDGEDEEYILIMQAPDAVICEMACGLLDENNITYIKRSDDSLGIFGVAMHSMIYVIKQDFERANEILTGYGFIGGKSSENGKNEEQDKENISKNDQDTPEELKDN